MKSVLLSVALLATLGAFGSVDVESAYYDGKNIVAELKYGGCGKPAFRLEFDRGCVETTPGQADAQVIQTRGNDGCERLNYGTFSFSLKGDPCGTSGHTVNLTGQGGRNTVRVEIP